MAKTPTDKTFKGIFAEYPEYAKDDYIWNKPLDKYTKKDIEALDDEIIDLSYHNGVAFLEQVGDYIKSHQTRISVLIGYLLFLITGLVGYLFKDGEFIIDSPVEYFVSALAIEYLVLMWLLYRLLLGWNIASVYFTPKEFLHKDRAKYHPKLLKLYTCRTLQVSAEKNLDILRKIAKGTKLYTTLFVGSSLSTIAIFVLLTHF